jgi:DNA-binding NarL/FixJ family response regulator
MVHIIIADDHQIVLDGLKTLLSSENDIKVLDTFTNGQDAVMYCRDFHVDVALLDINMPVMDGITACQHITNKKTNVIALTNHQELVYIYKMLNAGALGYVLKTTNKETLIQAVKTVSRKENFFCDDVRKQLINMDSFHNSGKTQETPTISKREKEILHLIIKEYTTKEIAAQLFIGQSTVETHRKNLLKKLRVKNTAGLVRLAYETNLLA